MASPSPPSYPEIIISHPGTDFDSLASMWASHMLNPSRPVVMIAGEDSNVREFLALYGREFPRVRLREINIDAVRHLTIVDCSSRAQLSRIAKLLDRPDVTVELWDHHREGAPAFKVDSHHYSPVGANTTMLAGELRKAGLVPGVTAATLMMLGIYEDTGSLRYPSTTSADLEIAAWLLDAGASLDTVDKFLDIRLKPAQKSLLTALSLNTRVVEVRGIPIHLTQANALEFVDEISYLVRKVQETESADVIFALVQMNDRVFIVGRSRLPSVDVGRILSVFGGGGHPQAASCLLTGTTHPVAMQRLLDAIREEVQPSILARDIMSRPVKTIGPDASILEADAVISRTGHSGLVVTDSENRVLGIITRREVDKALVHNLGHAPVRGYMVKDPVTVSEETSLSELESTIIERGAGFLPVLFGGKLSGVVTRTDVLGAIHRSWAKYRAVHSGAPPVKDAEERGRELLSLLPSSCVVILSTAGEIADRMGVNCFLVGGIVRDLVLGKKNVDIDLLVEGDGIAFAKELGEALNASVYDNTRFRTAKVMLEDGTHIDVVTAREEFYVRPGALPEVEAASIRDDLIRRDFSINTLAIQLNSRKWGLFIDHFGGLGDLANRLVRVLHTFSFVEDPTRILRALRFSARYGFSMERQTAELLRRALLEGRLDEVSPERVRDEILLCFQEENPWAALSRICEEGVFALLHPSLQPPQALRYEKDLVKEALDWCRQYLGENSLPEKPLVYTAYLISESEQEEAVSFLERYHFDNQALEAGETLEEFRRAEKELAKEGLRASEVVDLLDSLSPAWWVVLAARTEPESTARAYLEKYLRDYRKVQPVIGGKDLIKAGFEPGPGFASALDAVRKAKLDGDIKSPEEELELASRVLGEIRKPGNPL